MGRIREKICDRCYQPGLILYRVQIDETGEWKFICDRCWPDVRHGNPHYIYGGTWKARKHH